MNYSIIVTQVSAMTEFIKFISDNGVMIVISAVVIYFLVKVLNSMLEQNAKTNAQIVPQLQKIDESIMDVMVKFGETESRRIVTQNRQMNEIKELQQSIAMEIRSIETQLNDMKKSISVIEDELKRLNMQLSIGKKEDSCV